MSAGPPGEPAGVLITAPGNERRAGYDAGLILLEQDEDLLLYDVQFIPALLELAGDDRCPKRDYVFGRALPSTWTFASRRGVFIRL